MSADTTPRSWWPHFVGFVLVTALVHLLVVYLVPDAIMRVVISKVSTQTGSTPQSGTAGDTLNGALHAPPVTAQSRSIVMPSPDMLYSVCTFDVSKGSLRISAHPGLSTYWSIALYAANSDNFYVQNDRHAPGQAVSLTLVSRHSPEAAKPGVVIAPTDTGVLLMRVLTGNYEAEKAVLEPARRTLQCTSSAPA